MMSEVDDADPVAAAAAANGTTAAKTAALTPPLSFVQQQQQSRQQWPTTTAQTIMLGRDGEDRVTTTNTTCSTRNSPDWRKEKKSVEQHHHRRHSSLSSSLSSTTTTSSWWERTFRKNKNNSYDEGDNDGNIVQASSAASALENGTEHEHYTPLEEEDGSRANGRVHRLPLQAKKQMSRSQKKGSLLEEPNGRGKGDDGDEFSASNRMLTAEDVLERDCSFFYRQEEDHPVVSIGLQQQHHERDNRQRRHRFRTLLRQQDDPYHPRHAFLYQDAVDVQSPSVLQEYKMRYKQLNQAELFLDHDVTSAEDPFDEDVVVADDGDTNINNINTLTRMMPLLSHSLQLDENDTTGGTSTKTMTPRTASSSSSGSDGSNSIVRSDTAFHSSLCYLHHGRLLMRLPNDQVRLVMDPDLEAGILSVEQWRRPPSSSPKPKQPSRSAHQDQMETTMRAEAEQNEELPPLRYVLTVPMDLYQKLVQEMSHGITSRSSSSSSSSASSSVCAALCSSCCNCNIHYEHGNEKMDIRIAVWVLATVLILMFINTVIWGAGQ
jgi:hypothetical protein